MDKGLLSSYIKNTFDSRKPIEKWAQGIIFHRKHKVYGKISTYLETKNIPKETKCNSPLFYFGSKEEKSYTLFGRGYRAQGTLKYC